MDDGIDPSNVFGHHQRCGNGKLLNRIPVTAASRSDVTKSSMTTAANLSPKDSWLLLTRAKLWHRTALTTVAEGGKHREKGSSGA